MKNNIWLRWLLLVAAAFILSMLSVCLYAEVDESDKLTCSNYAICEGSGQ